MSAGRIQERREQFKRDISALDPIRVVRKHVLSSNAYALDGDRYFELQDKVSSHFDVHPSEVVVVGSAHFGFSIAPQKRYRDFGDSSDIDVAIVSAYLFDKVWAEAYGFWRQNKWWPEIKSFQEYLFRGWMRPDKLPPNDRFEFGSAWWRFFNELTAVGTFGPYKIRAGLYRSWPFLEKYQVVCVEGCVQEEQDHR
jgi:hypothetical protein